MFDAAKLQNIPDIPWGEIPISSENFPYNAKII